MHPLLCIQNDVEEQARQARLPKTRWGKFERWLCAVLHIVRQHIPHGRASAESQLRQRPAFPRSEWLRTNCPIEFVVGILQIVEREFDLPNHFLLPDDPLPVAFLPLQDFAHESVCLRLKKEFGVKITMADFQRMYSELGWTVGGFVEFAFRRKK